MNNQGNMLRRKQQTGVPEYASETDQDGQQFIPSHVNGMSMVRKKPPGEGPNQGVPAPNTSDAGDTVEEKEIITEQVPDKKAQAAGDAAAKKIGATRAELETRTAGEKKPRRQAADANTPTPAPAARPAAKPSGPIGRAKSPDELCRAYTEMFKSAFGFELSTAIVFENMRRMCEPDVKDPLKTLYFIENTYRVSTILYLASNLPILVVTSILAEKNRKNILKYVSIEVDHGAKPYEQLRDLRMKRWARKFENMRINDAMTVTPGATMLSPELVSEVRAAFLDMSAKLKRFNGEMSSIVAKFDDSALSDVTYIYSNWWYLLQGFENVPEMRSYIMAITDDTRRNLKL